MLCEIHTYGSKKTQQWSFGNSYVWSVLITDHRQLTVAGFIIRQLTAAGAFHLLHVFFSLIKCVYCNFQRAYVLAYLNKMYRPVCVFFTTYVLKKDGVKPIKKTTWPHLFSFIGRKI